MCRLKWLVVASVLFGCTVLAAEFHVSPDGSDLDAGSEKKPFLTLMRARDAARKHDGAVDVILHAGEYRLMESLELDGRDSDTTYRAKVGDSVRIAGGMAVAVDDLKKVEDAAVLERLPESVRNSVVVLKLPGSGSGGSATWPLRFRGYAGWPEVYVGGEAMRLARWPNDGYATIDKVLDKGSLPRDGEKPDRGGSFLFKEPSPTTWKPNEPIYLGGYWCFKWYDEFVRVESIDAARKQIKMAAPHQYGLGGPSKGLYYAINLLEELDQPGEYVYDGKKHVLYMILPEKTTGPVHVSVMRQSLVVIRNAKNVVFRGITFENGCAGGFDITDCDSVWIESCSIRQMSGSGILVSGGRDCRVSKCEIHAVGKSGVRLSGGDRETLTPSSHSVAGCRIHNFARLVKTYCPAVGLKGVGQVVSNNHFYDAPHSAVIFHGNDHQVTFNHIERVCQDTADAGAIYCGRDWALGGNRVHGNYIHDLGEATHHGTWGIYLDDMASGIEVSRNVVADTGMGFLVGGGRNNVIVDNVLINLRAKSIRYDARGVGWVSRSRTWLNKPDGTMWTRLNAIPYKTGIWADRFPYLATIEGDAYKEPRHNTVTGNRMLSAPAMDLDGLVTKHGTVADNTVAEAPVEIFLKDGQLTIAGKPVPGFETLVVGPW